MDKREFELLILDQDRERLLNYLKQNFTVENVTEVILIQNINTYKTLSGYKKRLLMSRLTEIEESHDTTTIISGIIALFLFFLGAYNKLVEKIIPNDFVAIIMSIVFTVASVLIFAWTFGREKRRKAKAKYFLMLFKDL